MSKVLGKGNYIVAKVNDVKMVLTSVELKQLLDNDYDVEVISPLIYSSRNFVGI